MINIVSKSYYRTVNSGPKKVVENLVKGLNKLNYPYVINKRLDACRRLWIHDDVQALLQINSLPSDVKVVVGPNLVTMPRHLPAGVDFSKAVYIHPSEWAKNFWETFGFHSCPIEAWPTGIDTQEFKPAGAKKDLVLVYFKQRLPSELKQLRALLASKSIEHEVLMYPTYSEKQFKRLLSVSKYCIWLGRQESQGIALQEAMAAGVPLLVWDVEKFGHWLASPKEMDVFTSEENAYVPATAAEYFDESCGLKVKGFSEVARSVDVMEARWQDFRPREYVERHLSLERQAREFVQIYSKYFGLTFDDGLREQVINKGDWINNSFKVRSVLLVKDAIKAIIRALDRVGVPK